MFLANNRYKYIFIISIVLNTNINWININNQLYDMNTL